MLNFFRRQPQRNYTVIYRYGSGHWFKRATVKAASRYEAQRLFDTDPQYDKCHRVSCTLEA